MVKQHRSSTATIRLALLVAAFQFAVRPAQGAPAPRNCCPPQANYQKECAMSRFNTLEEEVIPEGPYETLEQNNERVHSELIVKDIPYTQMFLGPFWPRRRKANCPDSDYHDLLIHMGWDYHQGYNTYDKCEISTKPTTQPEDYEDPLGVSPVTTTTTTQKVYEEEVDGTVYRFKMENRTRIYLDKNNYPSKNPLDRPPEQYDPVELKTMKEGNKLYRYVWRDGKIFTDKDARELNPDRYEKQDDQVDGQPAKYITVSNVKYYIDSEGNPYEIDTGNGNGGGNSAG